MSMNSRISPKTLAFLHMALFLSSLSGICSKFAGSYDLFSWGFAFWYGIVLAIMVVYAIAWQQILKKIPLTVAYSNKPVGLLWGMIWGAIIFHEQITWNMVLGACLVFGGIILVVTGDDQTSKRCVRTNDNPSAHETGRLNG